MGRVPTRPSGRVFLHSFLGKRPTDSEKCPEDAASILGELAARLG